MKSSKLALALAALVCTTACQKPQTVNYRNSKSSGDAASMEQQPAPVTSQAPVGATPEPPARETNTRVITPEEAKAQEEEEKKKGIIDVVKEATIGDVNKCAECEAKVAGDIVHRKSGPSSVFVGHSGIYAGNDMYMHVTSRNAEAEGAMAIVPRANFFESSGKTHDSYGAKRPKSHPDGLKPEEFEKLKKYTQELIDIGVKYDTLHLNQKGKFYSQVKGEPVIGGPGYFKFDCVGYVEAVFEDKEKGLNIDLTPNKYESGLGIPLTVREQRDSENLVDVK